MFLDNHQDTDWYLGYSGELLWSAFFYCLLLDILGFMKKLFHVVLITWVLNFFPGKKAQNLGMSFLTFIILYNNLIPISLTVTLEV